MPPGSYVSSMTAHGRLVGRGATCRDLRSRAPKSAERESCRCCWTRKQGPAMLCGLGCLVGTCAFLDKLVLTLELSFSSPPTPPSYSVGFSGGSTAPHDQFFDKSRTRVDGSIRERSLLNPNESWRTGESSGTDPLIRQSLSSLLLD